jgi:hypothetical protein
VGHWMNKTSPEAALVLCSLGCHSGICIGAIKCWSTKKNKIKENKEEEVKNEYRI